MLRLVVRELLLLLKRPIGNSSTLRPLDRDRPQNPDPLPCLSDGMRPPSVLLCRDTRPSEADGCDASAGGWAGSMTTGDLKATVVLVLLTITTASWLWPPEELSLDMAGVAASGGSGLLLLLSMLLPPPLPPPSLGGGEFDGVVDLRSSGPLPLHRPTCCRTPLLLFPPGLLPFFFREKKRGKHPDGAGEGPCSVAGSPLPASTPEESTGGGMASILPAPRHRKR